jgi:hypothetical protein
MRGESGEENRAADYIKILHINIKIHENQLNQLHLPMCITSGVGPVMWTVYRGR